MVIVDSITKPIKDSIGANTQNLPARAQLMERLFGKLFEIATRHDIAMIVTHHATVNPVTPFGRDFGKIWGGDSTMYNSKYAIEFIGDCPLKIRNETGWTVPESRRVKLIRRPDAQADGELHPIRLKNDWGYVDK
jgi:RecA/RadA recombinase